MVRSIKGKGRPSIDSSNYLDSGSGWPSLGFHFANGECLPPAAASHARRIATSANFSAALRPDGRLVGWGFPSHGAQYFSKLPTCLILLGDGSVLSTHPFLPPPPWLKNVRAVFAAQQTFIAFVDYPLIKLPDGTTWRHLHGCARFFTEYFRTPDYEVNILGATISAGQMLSFPMIIGGLLLLAFSYKFNKK